jgi:hypothetical protein
MANYLYAREAVRVRKPSADIVAEIGSSVARRIVPFVQAIVRREGAESEATLLAEVFDIER